MEESQVPMETPHEMISTKRRLAWACDKYEKQKDMLHQKEARDQDYTPIMWP